MIMYLKFIIMIVPILICVAFLTLMERKVLSFIMMRKGPNKAVFSGIFQPFADALKLSNKQENLLTKFFYFFYYFSTIFMMILSCMLWELISFKENSSMDVKMSSILIILIMSFITLKLIVSGWSTSSKFSMLGSLRSLVSILSYESLIFMFIMMYISLNFSYSLTDFEILKMFNFWFYLPFLFLIWMISCCMEMNRTPFDFSESESELVSGFNTEFGSKSFTLIFLSEYSMMIFMMIFSCILFFKENTLNIMFFILIYTIIWIRAIFPRFRFDFLMSLCWKNFIPILTIFLMDFIFFK